MGYPIPNITLDIEITFVKYVPRIIEYLGRSTDAKIREKNNGTKPPATDVVQTCMCLVLGYVPAAIFDSQYDEMDLYYGPPTQLSSQIALFTGMAGIMIYAKGLIRNKNEAYLKASWSAYIEGAKLISLIDMDACIKGVASYQTDISQAHPDLETAWIKEIVHNLTVGLHKTANKDLMTQVQMVYTGAGLKALEVMDIFCDKKESRVFVMSPHVVDDAIQFKKDWTKYKQEQNWQFGRLLGLPSVPKHRTYPDLYVAALTWALHTGLLGSQERFAMSKIKTKSDKDMLKREAIRDLSAYT